MMCWKDLGRWFLQSQLFYLKLVNMVTLLTPIIHLMLFLLIDLCEASPVRGTVF